MKTISKEVARKVMLYGYYDDMEYRYFHIHRKEAFPVFPAGIRKLMWIFCKSAYFRVPRRLIGKPAIKNSANYEVVRVCE